MTLIAQNINQNNLLRFRSVTTPTVSTSTLATQLHSGTRKWRRNIMNPLPALKTETYTFYTNFNAPTFDQANIVVVSDSNCDYTILSDIDEPSVVATVWGTNNLKIVLTIPSSATENRFIRIGATDGVNLTHVSNLFMVLPFTEETINNTHLFKFYHNSNIYNYEWSAFDPETDTPYTVRIPSTVKAIEYPREVSTYEAATTGVPRNTRSLNRKDYQFQIYFREDGDHDALAVLINFKKLLVNSKEFLPIEGYEVEYNDSFNLYVGMIKLRDVSFSVRINRCTT